MLPQTRLKTICRSELETHGSEKDLQVFLEENGVLCEPVTAGNLIFIRARFIRQGRNDEVFILPASCTATSVREAESYYRQRSSAKEDIRKRFGNPEIITVPEDRWKSRNLMYRQRLLSHTGHFRSVFARNCTAEKIDRSAAGAFLEANHSYGAASCRYCYALKEKLGGQTVAVAAFSNARKWLKDGREIKSYEWVRYASENGTRVAGGMGKLLRKFIGDVRPDDIMSYADLEWSDGAVYRRLGFTEDGFREPVLCEINPDDWSRRRYARAGEAEDCRNDIRERLWYMNDGSLKYRLKLTCYSG